MPYGKPVAARSVAMGDGFTPGGKCRKSTVDAGPNRHRLTRSYPSSALRRDRCHENQPLNSRSYPLMVDRTGCDLARMPRQQSGKYSVIWCEACGPSIFAPLTVIWSSNLRRRWRWLVMHMVKLSE